MVARLVALSLRHRLVVLVLAAVLVGVGAFAAATAPLDVFPEFAPPQVEVQVEAPGFATEDVEALVTTPLEHALAGTKDLTTLRSTSAPGLATLIAYFPYEIDVDRARTAIVDRLALAQPLLPPDVEPQVAPLASALSTIAAVGLRTDGRIDALALRDLAQWTMRPRLLAVPGVADVVVYGGAVRQVEVSTSPERLQALGLTLDDVAAAVGEADAAAGSGFLDRGGQRLLTRLDGRLRTADELARVGVAARDGVPVPLAAVATVHDAAAVPVGDALVRGDPGVLLLVTKQPDVNAVELTDAVGEALAALAHALPRGVVMDPDLFHPASFVVHAVGNLGRAVVFGAVLVAIVLLLFLGHWRPVLVSVLAIPLSLLAAVCALRALGASVNVMVLGGLAIATGEVVDDAILDVENVWRRLRAAPQGTRRRDVVLQASVEVRSAVVSATLMVALVFVPVFLLGGLQGALFRPLGAAYVLAALASLAVALTVTPALALLLLPAVARDARPPRVVVGLRRHYERALAAALAHPRRVALAVGMAVVAGAACIPGAEIAFLPEFRETSFVMHMTAAPGTGLDEVRRVAATVEQRMLAVPGVASVAQFVGRSTLSEDVWGVERSEMLLRLAPEADPEAVVRGLRDVAAGIAGFAFDVKQYLNERIDELLEGSGAAILVRVHGTDLDVLGATAREVAARIARVPGAVDVHAETALDAPGVRVRLHREALRDAGVTPHQVERAVRASLGGMPVGHVVRDAGRADVVLRLDTDAAHDPARLGRLPLLAADGRVVALGAVADVGLTPQPTAVVHEAGTRIVVVRADAAGRTLGAVARDVERVVTDLRLPPGVWVEVGGDVARAASAARRLAGQAALVLIGIFAVLLADFGSPRLAALTMVNVPLALVGGLIAVRVGAGGQLSLGAVVGFVTVLGITLRNGIVLLAHLRRLERERGAHLAGPALVTAAADRLAPIVMTALVTGIALLPLLFLHGRPGGEIEQPLAVVIVGGLVTSTLLNLFVVPVWYAAWGRQPAPPD